MEERERSRSQPKEEVVTGRPVAELAHCGHTLRPSFLTSPVGLQCTLLNRTHFYNKACRVYNTHCRHSTDQSQSDHGISCYVFDSVVKCMAVALVLFDLNVNTKHSYRMYFSPKRRCSHRQNLHSDTAHSNLSLLTL